MKDKLLDTFQYSGMLCINPNILLPEPLKERPIGGGDIPPLMKEK